MILLCSLLIIAVIDYQHRIIPNGLLLFLLIAKLLLLFHTCFYSWEMFLKEGFLSLTGLSFFGIICFIFYRFAGSTIGGGDLKLLITLGFYLGFYECLSFCAWLLFEITLMILLRFLLKGKILTGRIPLGPLVFGAGCMSYIFV